MGSMVFGYARVSTQDQELARQIDALGKYGVDEVFTEKMTGIKTNRPELNRLKDKVRSGDTVVIESLSRLGRSTKDLLSLIEDWNHQGVKLVSLKESIDTTTPTGKLLFQTISMQLLGRDQQSPSHIFSIRYGTRNRSVTESNLELTMV